MNDRFLSGVVEGFYGQPWSARQRSILFEQMTQWGLNTYMYSPKDDLKHRAIWRQLYDRDELADLGELVRQCLDRGLRFIYGLSPGLDIRFSDSSEVDRIKSRFQQLIDLGVQDFALLFDDLPGKIELEDQARFDSVAAAQCHVTNQVHAWLREGLPQSHLLFCPTPYCDRMARWKLGGEGYLEIVGSALAPEIDVLWTGPEIISETIPEPSIQALTRQIGRRPVIWDNLHANDYDLRRSYCGPYAGRSAEFMESIRGVLVNPNNEFWLNFVPIKTFSEFIRSPSEYEPRETYIRAMEDWSALFEVVGESVTTEQVRLLADCYYLPHSLGAGGHRILKLVTELIRDPITVPGWEATREEFLGFHESIEAIFDGLTRLTNRELFYAWSRRIWEFKEEMDLLRDFIDAKRDGRLSRGGFASETHLLNTYRGGIVASLQRELRIDAAGMISEAPRENS